MAVGGRTFAIFGDAGSGLHCAEALFALRLFNTVLFMLGVTSLGGPLAERLWSAGDL